MLWPPSSSALWTSIPGGIGGAAKVGGMNSLMRVRVPSMVVKVSINVSYLCFNSFFCLRSARISCCNFLILLFNCDTSSSSFFSGVAFAWLRTSAARKKNPKLDPVRFNAWNHWHVTHVIHVLILALSIDAARSSNELPGDPLNSLSSFAVASNAPLLLGVTPTFGEDVPTLSLFEAVIDDFRPIFELLADRFNFDRLSSVFSFFLSSSCSLLSAMSSRVCERRLFFSPPLPLLFWRLCPREGEWCGEVAATVKTGSWTLLRTYIRRLHGPNLRLSWTLSLSPEESRLNSLKIEHVSENKILLKSPKFKNVLVGFFYVHLGSSCGWPLNFSFQALIVLVTVCNQPVFSLSDAHEIVNTAWLLSWSSPVTSK